MTANGRAVIATAAIALIGLAVWTARPDTDAELVIGDTVAEDFATLAQATHTRFVDAAPAVASCMGDLRLEADPDLDDLARYDQSSGIMYVRVPATAPSLEASLIHEFAHHVELACASHLSVRPAFLAAQGRAADTAWFGDGAWEDRPSEQFAEAVVEVVLGRRSRNQLRLRLTPEAVRVVEAWLTSG